MSHKEKMYVVFDTHAEGVAFLKKVNEALKIVAPRSHGKCIHHEDGETCIVKLSEKSFHLELLKDYDLIDGHAVQELGYYKDVVITSDQ